jgi:hypothetical protein
MKKLNNCEVPNCIPTPSQCVEWNGGDIDYLGICNGESLNTLLWEIIGKLQAIAGEDLTSFDLDSLLTICNTKAPQEVTLLSILNIIKTNQLCLKDYTDSLSKAISALTSESKINVDLKCYQQFDNLGNRLNISRDQLDQLIINELCDHEQAISSLNGLFTSLKEELESFMAQKPEVEEQTCSTCVDAAVKPVSSQLIEVAQAHCDLQTATGSPTDIQTGLSKVPASWNTDFSTLPGWNATASNQAQILGNALLVIGNLTARIKFMETNCCALTCDDIQLGFSAVLNDAGDAITLKFTWGAGTKIPNGVVDKGSSGTLTDIYGNVESFNLALANDAQIDVPLSGTSTDGEIKISINAKLGTDTLVCQKCLNKTVTISNTKCCEVTNTSDSSVTIIYEIN